MTIAGRVYLQRRGFLEWFAGSAYSFILPPARVEHLRDIDDDAVQVADSEVLLDLDAIPALTDVPGFFPLPGAKLVVVRAGDADFRAFGSECTHAGCGTGGQRGSPVICPRHASEFDLDGVPIAGAAPLPLDRYVVDFIPDLRVVRIDRRRRVSNSTMVERLNGARQSTARPVGLASSARP